ncbi:hypothetical protein BJX96DRAFT_172817 [Aspergillus floccosus]
MALESRNSEQLGRITDRLGLYQNQLRGSDSHSSSTSSTTSATAPAATAAAMSRDPITCHVLNTLSGTPAANLRVTLTLLSGPDTVQSPLTYTATTDADGRVKNWAPLVGHSATVPAVLSALPTPDSKTNWSVRFEVGPWYEAQGVESFWPEVEVKFTVKGRGREGEEGWRHYHVPVLLGPWNYSTYRGS